MWVFTTGGFTSAVEHRDDKSLTMVRARDKKSLEEMLSGIEKGFVESGKTEEEAKDMVKDWKIYAVVGDYKWRVVVPKSAYAVFLMYEAMHYVNYSNFKSKLTATRGQKWHDVAMKVWSAMFGIEDHGVKTGVDAVDNPKPYSYYHSEFGDDFGYTPTTFGKVEKKGQKKGLSVWQKGKQTEGTAEGSETDWVDDAYGAGFYDHSYDTTEGNSYRWSGNGLFKEDDEDWDPTDPKQVSSGTNGYHTFSGKDFRIDGRGEIVDGQFIGAEFFNEDGGDHVPTDAELEEIERNIDASWEPWDEETEYNTVTGETRSKIDGSYDMTIQGGIPRSVLAMTDAEFLEMERQEAGLGANTEIPLDRYL